ncbi:DMT family transporter [Nocardioides panacisoli]|uniref:DMT family transporter n=1 Tax=Nocardioides panacisoli TaxID=627624 RepID=UPI001C62DA07|nr:DMT family transporter [Nocardioides panacisoli]QYJ05373.1 DMT family transporter [Nocardioides panacisoli]
MSLLGVGFALLAGMAYGVSDFVGGVASRRTSPWPVTLLSAVGGLVGAVGLGLWRPGDPTAVDLGWGLAAGLGGGLGVAYLYRGMAAGRLGVVGPVSAVGAALLPVAVGFALGERPPLLAWCGIVLALPGVWLVAQEPGETKLAEGLRDGLLSGAGFGILFIGLGQVPESAGFWPIATSQTGTLVAAVGLGLAYAAPLRPTHRVHAWGLVAGALGTVAMLGYTLAVQTGLLTLAAVMVAALYPAFTVLLARLVLREHVWRAQWVGLGISAVAVTLVTVA